MGDLMIHIDEELDSTSLTKIEEVIGHTNGVSDCHMAPDDLHMVAVSYDGSKVSSSTLLHKVTALNLHAQLVGL